MPNIVEFVRFVREKMHQAQHPELGDPDIAALIAALGGRWNIREVDACITRLRVTVKDLAKVNSGTIQSLGALGVVILGHQVQAIFGKRSDNLKRRQEEHFGLDETST